MLSSEKDALYDITKIASDQSARVAAARDWHRKQGAGVEPSISERTFTDEAKIELLKTFYKCLYDELRDKDSRLQQIVTWGFTVLGGAGVLALSSIPASSTYYGAFIVSLAGLIIIFLIGFWLSKTIHALSTDRMSLARQLDRINQIFGAFRPGFYCKDTSLFTPMYYGWGFDPENDSNNQLARLYIGMLWLLCTADFILVSAKQALSIMRL